MPVKLTRNRQAVFDQLSQEHSPLSAYDILDRLHAIDPKWKPATVYRALNYLIGAGLVHRIESEQKFLSCAHKDCSHFRQFLICEKCGGVEEAPMPNEVIDYLSNIAQQHQFSLRSPYVEFRGYCQSCQIRLKV